MHEFAITESLLEIALRHGKDAGATQITDLYLVIGALSSIVDDSVQFYWDIVAKDSLAEGAELHFNRLNVEMCCQACEHVYEPKGDDISCPACSSIDVRIQRGEEFYLESISIEGSNTNDEEHEE